ncbi:MAG: hypothetical protein H7Y42_03140 [Chitinophagaceae bacterium]|nr:hypothetical protein [Chitinophagaceae bacterium]
MKIRTRILGIIAMASSPFLFAQMSLAGNANTSLGGLCGLIYMIGWSCVIVALMRYRATGERKAARVVLYLQLSLLFIANIWNVWTILDPGNSSPLYFILDFSWPASNVCLLVTGIVVAEAAVLTGWKRYSVLIAGTWLPVTLCLFILIGQGKETMIVSGIYSTIAWFFMGYMVYRSAQEMNSELSIVRK